MSPRLALVVLLLVPHPCPRRPGPGTGRRSAGEEARCHRRWARGGGGDPAAGKGAGPQVLWAGQPAEPRRDHSANHLRAGLALEAVHGRRRPDPARPGPVRSRRRRPEIRPRTAGLPQGPADPPPRPAGPHFRAAGVFRDGKAAAAGRPHVLDQRGLRRRLRRAAPRSSRCSSRPARGTSTATATTWCSPWWWRGSARSPLAACCTTRSFGRWE